MKIIKKIWDNKENLMIIVIQLCVWLILGVAFAGAGIVSIRFGGVFYTILGLIFISGTTLLLHELVEIIKDELMILFKD